MDIDKHDEKGNRKKGKKRKEIRIIKKQKQYRKI